MDLLQKALSDFSMQLGNRLYRPEYRQIELYTKRKNLPFAAPTAEGEEPVHGVLGAVTAFNLLECHLQSSDPTLEDKKTWQRYLSLPRRTNIEKLVAEVYRILRIVRAAFIHPHGGIESKDGVIRIGGPINGCSLSLNISQVGLDLLQSFVVHYLESFRHPYPDAYVEALLLQYFVDIVAEIKKFADEDRVLYQFRHKFRFNRHFRFDCDNPKYDEKDGYITIEIGGMYEDKRVFPIDFFVIVDNLLHIIPVEVLDGNKIAHADLPQWRAKLTNGTDLPPHFRTRFGREVMVVGLPMT